RYRYLLGLLQEIDPVSRGIDCAILVRSNSEGAAIVDFIRAHSSLSVVNEADESVGDDNPLSAALLSLFQFAAHPGDTFAWQHLMMTPFAEIFLGLGLEKWRVGAKLRESIQHQGFALTTKTWLERLSATTPLDDFARKRAQEFLFAARQFDDRGSRSIDEFIEHLRQFTLRDPSSGGSIQVMTIHKSKGLDFDAVILPQLGGRPLGGVAPRLGVRRQINGTVDWVMELPPMIVSGEDPVLSEFLEADKAERIYEDLCVYYVAMTRAKHANYLLIDHTESSRSSSFAKILFDSLASDERMTSVYHEAEAEILFTAGDHSWFEKLQPTLGHEPPDDKPKPLVFRRNKTVQHHRRAASEDRKERHSGARIFSAEGRRSREFGNAIHKLLESIEWIEEWAPPKPTSEIDAIALDQIQASLADAEIRNHFTRPSPNAKVWRERRFEIILDGQWISGAFDRVVFDGRHITLTDFKTSEVPEDSGDNALIERHREQIETYCQVLDSMFRSSAKIRGRLLSIPSRRVIDVVV
ncbi:MAG: 3'-5' exonuclease, partial [Verrucomicrobiota bacterium]